MNKSRVDVFVANMRLFYGNLFPSNYMVPASDGDVTGPRSAVYFVALTLTYTTASPRFESHS